MSNLNGKRGGATFDEARDGKQIPELIGRAIMQAEGMITCEADAA